MVRSMVANQNLPTVMAQDGLVDGSPTQRRPGKTSWCLSMFDPLAEQFGNVHRRAPVRVGSEPAFALERTPLPHAFCTAPRTRLRGVSCAYQADFDALLPSHALQSLPEHRVGHPLYLAVALSVELCIVQPPEVFDGNGGVVLLGEGNNFMRLLVASRLVEVPFVSPEFPKNAPRPPRALRGVSLKLGATDAQVSLDLPHVAPEIQLPLDFSILEDGDGCERTDPNIHPDYRLAWFGFGDLELALECDPSHLEVEQLELGECPAVFKQPVEPSPSAVLGDGKTEPAVKRGDAQNRVVPLRLFERAASGDVVGDGQTFELCNLVLPLCPDFLPSGADELGGELGFFTDVGIGEVVELGA